MGNWISFILCNIFGVLLLNLVDCSLTWEIIHYKENPTGYTWEEADAICKQNGYILAVVDSLEKWNKVVYNITGGNRYTAEADVYIGLVFTPSMNNFSWVSEPGVAASWTKWFTNEPYYTETRHCVRLDVYANYEFRTTDCSYKHHFVCSYEVPEVSQVENSSDDSNTAMILGMSVGFGIFLGVFCFICILCRCCCNFQEDEKEKPFHPPTRKTHAHGSKVSNSANDLFTKQTRGANYQRAKSGLSTSMGNPRFTDEMYDDYGVNSGHVTKMGGHESGRRSEFGSLNDSSSPSTVKSDEYLHFM